MAHECSECGQVCYCGGDIDDCLFNGTPEELHCRHCDDRDDDPQEQQDNQDMLDSAKAHALNSGPCEHPPKQP